MAEGIGQPFNRKLIPYLLGGFIVVASLGFFMMMAKNNPVEARKAKEAADKLEALKSQPKGDPKTAAEVVNKSESAAREELMREAQKRRAEGEAADKQRMKDIEDYMKRQGMPAGAPPAPPVDPALAAQMRQAHENATGAASDGKFFEQYDAQNVQPFKGDGVAVDGLNYMTGSVESARSDQNQQGQKTPAASKKKSQKGKEEDNPWGDKSGDSDKAIAIKPKFPAGEYLLAEGSVVRGVMITGINSLNPGTVIVRVTYDVYDSITGANLLIPRGSRMIGVYKNKTTGGDERVLVAFKRLMLPDGRSMDLPAMPGVDAQGQPGVSGEYYSNIWKAVGPAAIVGAIGQLLQPKNQNSTVNVYTAPGSSSGSGSVAQQVFPVLSQRVMQSSAGAVPYTVVDPGTEIVMVVTGDILIEPNTMRAELKN